MSSSPISQSRKRVRPIVVICAVFVTIASGWARRQYGAPSDLPSRHYSSRAVARPDKRVITPEAIITVNSTADVANGTDGLCTLREAIAAVNNNAPSGVIPGECGAGSSSGSDAIDLTGLTGTINLSGALPDLTSNTIINGPGSSVLTVRMNNGGASRIFTASIASPGVVTISGLTITNGVISPLSGLGGGILNNNTGTINVNDCIITSNFGGDGGGIYNSGTLTLTNSTVSGNSSAHGGGIYNGGTLTLTNSTVSGNSTTGIDASSLGGGIYNSGTLTLTNSTVSGNSSPYRTGFGGGIFNSAGTLTLTNSTVSGNQAFGLSGLEPPGITGPCGGICNVGVMILRNTIVAGNSAPDTNGTLDPSSSFNLIGGDPRLGPLANNGGPTMTHALLPGSPALDSGSNDLATNAGLATDQRGAGFSRSVDGPDANTTATVDIGAFEAQTSLEDIPDKTINEDTQLQFAFNLGGTTTTVTATSSNTSLVPNNTANIALTGNGSTRTLTINPLANQFGTSTITITVNGPNSQSMTDTFLLTVNSVNDQPSFTKGPDQTVSNNAGPQTINNWATNISAGPANESNQTLAFIVTSNSNPSLFTSAPAISAAGTLTYQFAPTAGGMATITVVLQDNGGTTNGGIDTSLPQTFTINVVPLGGFISFSTDTYNTPESSGFVTTTVKRTGDLSRAVTVDYATSADNGLPCSTASGVATPKCDFTTALGTLNFAAGENTKTVTIFISQDAFVEGPETFSLLLSNPTAGAALAMPSTATITIADDVTEPPMNSIDDARNFVRQHYHDFLNREPDPSGWDFWTNQITSCGSDSQCIDVRRVNVSASFFLSIEFQQTGYFVERFYKVGYGDATGTSQFQFNHQVPVPMVRFNEFIRDTQRIGQGVVVLAPGWEQALENNKQAYALEFVQTSRFIAALPTTLSPDQFVDRLNQNTGGVLTLSERAAVINLFGGAGNTSNVTARAQAVRQVADDADLYNGEFNRAFVLAEYFGYLRRNPNDTPETTMDYTGYDFWVTKLNQFNGNYINSEMVKAFLSSIEYRQRFGP